MLLRCGARSQAAASSVHVLWFAVSVSLACTLLHSRTQPTRPKGGTCRWGPVLCAIVCAAGKTSPQFVVLQLLGRARCCLAPRVNPWLLLDQLYALPDPLLHDCRSHIRRQAPGTWFAAPVVSCSVGLLLQLWMWAAPCLGPHLVAQGTHPVLSSGCLCVAAVTPPMFCQHCLCSQRIGARRLFMYAGYTLVYLCG